MVPCLDESRALAFLAGELTAAEREDAEGHIDECAACRTMLAALVRTASPGSGDRAAAASWHDGQRVGRYVVEGPLGRGGMGVVVRARDPELGRPVALKRLHSGGGAADPAARARLVREARAAAQLAHPNVIAVYEVGEDAGTPFIAMELVDGITLTAWLAAAPRSWREIVKVLAQAGRGLAAAHERGLVHRDFKPDNVLIDRAMRARVGDFGLARAWDGERGAAARDEGLARVTATGIVSGTPAYLAPELVDGGAPGVASDQFAFAVTLHEALRGQHPFAGSTPTALWAEMAAGRIREGGRAIPRWLDRAIRRGLAVEPAARWPSVGALCDVLERPPRRAWPWLAAAVAVAVASLAVAIAALVVVHRPAEPALTRSGMAPAIERLLADATSHEVDGQHAASLAGAEVALVADPRNPWAHQLVASEACFVHFARVARLALPGVPAQMRDIVVQSCRAFGVDPEAGRVLPPPPAPEPVATAPLPAAAPAEPVDRGRVLDEVAGDYMSDPAQALARVERVLAGAPADQRALMLAVLAACDLDYKQQLHHGSAAQLAHSEAKARAYAARLTPAHRWDVWTECDRWSGIWLEGDIERGGRIEHIGPRPPRPASR